MRCDYCDTETTLVNEWYEVTCKQCQFEHEVMNRIIDCTPANDGQQSTLFITLQESGEIVPMTIEETKAFVKNLQTSIRVAEEMQHKIVEKQPTLFDRPPVNRNTTISGKRHTSRVAAERALPKSGTKRAIIFEYIERFKGLTADELQAMTGISPNTINPTIRGLFLDGWLIDSGETRLTRTESPAIVWKVQL